MRVVTYRGEIHGVKSVPGVHVARGEFDEIARFDCNRQYQLWAKRPIISRYRLLADCWCISTTNSTEIA